MTTPVDGTAGERLMRSKFVATAPIALAALLFATLALASSARHVFINCYPTASSVPNPALLPRQHPRSCDIQGEPEDQANLLALRAARWSHWGSASTGATGRALDNHPGMGGPASVPVGVRLYRIRRGCRGHMYYTRVAVTPRKPGARTGTLLITPDCHWLPVGSS